MDNDSRSKDEANQSCNDAIFMEDSADNSSNSRRKFDEEDSQPVLR